MKVQATLPLLAGLFCVCCAAEPMSREPDSLEVKNMVNSIDSHLKALNRSSAMLQTGTDRGGELTIYRRGANVARIDATIGGSNSDLQDVFYYSSAKLVFVRRTEVSYPYSPASHGFDFGNPHVEATTDYYIRDRKLTAIGHVKIAPSVASRLLREAEVFISAARRGNQTVDIEKLLK
jgi:hypothetical protein